MNHLLRSLAPISEAGWKLLDGEAKQRLKAALAARKLVDFAGPHGWEHSATNLGRTTAVSATPCEGVTALQRRVLPLVELRADFAVSREELRDHDRGAPRSRPRKPRQGRAPDRGGRERRRVPGLEGGDDHRHRRSVATRAAPARSSTPTAMRVRLRRPWSCCCGPGSAGRTVWHSGPTSTRA